jgi:MATE family multidrug resistance protein
MSPAARVEVRETLRLAFPLALAQLGFVAMGFVDLMMVGDLGKTAMGGVGIASALFFTPLLALSAILMCLDSLVGSHVGAGQDKICGDLLWQGYWLALVMALLVTGLFFFGEFYALHLGQTDEVAVETQRYLQARGWSALPFLVFAAQRGFLSGTGNTRPILYTVLFTNLVNAGADWMLIYGKWGAPKLGVEGAGYASTISTVILMVVLGYWVHVDKRSAPYRTPMTGPSRVQIRRILMFGGPFGLHLLVEVGAFNIVAVLAGVLSEAELAAHQIAINLASMTYMVPLGISFAASVRVSQSLGAGNRQAGLLAGRVALGIGAVFMSLCCIFFLLFRAPLVEMFNVDDPAVLSYGTSLLGVAAFFQVSDALQVIGAGCYRGGGDTRTPLVANLIGHWFVALPIGVLLAFHFELGVTGLWIGLLIGLSLVGSFLCVSFLKGRWGNPTTESSSSAQ